MAVHFEDKGLMFSGGRCQHEAWEEKMSCLSFLSVMTLPTFQPPASRAAASFLAAWNALSANSLRMRTSHASAALPNAKSRPQIAKLEAVCTHGDPATHEAMWVCQRQRNLPMLEGSVSPGTLSATT